MNRSPEEFRGAKKRRSGSIMILVLVAMLVVGLMVLQSSQLMIAFHQGDRQERLLEQNRELIELGLAKAKNSLTRDKDYVGEEFSVPVWDSARFHGETPSEKTGRVLIEIRTSREGIAGRVRITAKYPAGEPGELVSTWESP